MQADKVRWQSPQPQMVSWMRPAQAQTFQTAEYEKP